MDAGGRVTQEQLPRVNLTRFHGVFAPNSKWRKKITPVKRGKTKKLPEEKCSEKSSAVLSQKTGYRPELRFKQIKDFTTTR